MRMSEQNSTEIIYLIKLRHIPLSVEAANSPEEGRETPTTPTFSPNQICLSPAYPLNVISYCRFCFLYPQLYSRRVELTYV